MKLSKRTKSEPSLCNTETHCSLLDLSHDYVSHRPPVCNGTDTCSLDINEESVSTSTDICDDNSQYVALDCEFVGVGPKQLSALGMFARKNFWFLMLTNSILMGDSTKVLRPLFNKTEILILGDSRAFSRLWAKCEILICYRNEEKWLYWSSALNLSGCAKPEIVLLRFGHHIALSRWRPRLLNTISGFALVDIAAFRRSKSMSKPNFVDISQLMAEI